MSLTLALQNSKNKNIPAWCSKCTPTIAVDDPNLMVKMPKGLTAATGMDVSEASSRLAVVSLLPMPCDATGARRHSLASLTSPLKPLNHAL